MPTPEPETPTAPKPPTGPEAASPTPAEAARAKSAPAESATAKAKPAKATAAKATPTAKPSRKQRTPEKPSAKPPQPAAPSADGPPSPAGEAPPAERRGFRLVSVMRSSSWLASLCVHIVLILVLALLSLPSLPTIDLRELLATSSDDAETFDDVPLIDFEEVDFETEPIETELTPDTTLVTESVDLSAFDEPAAATVAELSDFGITSAIAGEASDATGTSGEAYGRGKASRALAVRKRGGSAASEEAVANALRWLARHQNPDGSWSLMHHVGPCNGRCANPGVFNENSQPIDSLRAATGLALLPFLGAGQTHETGKHRDTVARGLAALVAMGQPNKKGPGKSWMDKVGRMYSHGIASIALCEAYGVTGDPSLRGPAQSAVDFISYAQYADGGWRYQPRQPGAVGDTSVVGWQVMALKSGFLANLSVDPNVARGAYKFLDTVQADGGARYGYVVPSASEFNKLSPSPTRSAVGLLARMYLGWDKGNAALKDGVARLAKTGPSENNYYQNYYAAQVLFQHTSGEGPVWREFNKKLRDQLVAQQATTGHARGSWYLPGPHNERAGRLYMTSLATMTLEVYYRYLPIYKLNTASVEFPE